jgi:hypothetical protein
LVTEPTPFGNPDGITRANRPEASEQRVARAARSAFWQGAMHGANLAFPACGA